MQSRRLNELVGGAAGFDPAAALAIITPANQPARTVAGGQRWGMLNEAQSLAVDSGLRDGITWLWVPPGTGKTTTLSSTARRAAAPRPANPAHRTDQHRGRRRAPGGARTHEDHRRWQRGAGRAADGHPSRRSGRRTGAGRGDRGAPWRTVTADLVRVTERIRQLRVQLREREQSRRNAGGDYDRLQVELADQQAMARALNRLLAEVRRQVCQDAHLAPATSHQLLMPTLSGMAFDIVVIDKAGVLPASLTMTLPARAVATPSSPATSASFPGGHRRHNPREQVVAAQRLRGIRRSRPGRAPAAAAEPGRADRATPHAPTPGRGNQ